MSDVYAVGYEGTLLHHDGTSNRFEPVDIEDLAGTIDLYAVWGTASNNVYIAGEQGFFARFDGTSWSRIWIDETDIIRAINGSGPNNFYLCAYHRVYHYDGTRVWPVTQNAANQTLYDINLSSAA